MNRRPSTASRRQLNRTGSSKIAGWVVASTFSLVVAGGFGTGTAWAGPANEGTAATNSPSSNSHQAEPSNGKPDRPRPPDTTPNTSLSRGAGAGFDPAAKEDAAETKSLERGSDRTAEPHGRRVSDAPEAENSNRERTASAAITTVTDGPVTQTPLKMTGRQNDSKSIPTELVEYDKEPPGEPARKVSEPSPSPGQASVDKVRATKPVEAAEISATSTTPTASPSALNGHNPSAIELTVTPTTVAAVQALVDIAAREGNVNPLVSAAADAAAGLNVAPPAGYTGQPSFVQQVVVFVLRVVNAVLSPVGGILAFTPLKVPIFADGVPPFFVTAGLNVRQDTIAGMPVYILTPPTPTGATVVALHGGAYVAEASLFHWELYADLARRTGATVIVPDYPLIGEPGGTADVVVPQTAELLSNVIATRGAENVSVLGDSAGGGLALAAVQLLVASGAATPGRMVLLAPWLDATVSDTASAAIWDPLLNVQSLIRDGELWAGELGPTHPWASPINGPLEGLPPITVYSGSLDLLSPQALRLRERANAEGADITFELRNGLMHDYPIFFFLPDALAERPSIYRALLGEDSRAQGILTADTYISTIGW
jgi:triacylglycerol lipase